MQLAEVAYPVRDVGGVPARVYQVEEKREEEVAVEESQAFSRASSDDGGPVVPAYLPAIVLILAIGAASMRGRTRGRPRAAPAFTSINPSRRSQP